MTAKRTAEATWESDLLHGGGHVQGMTGVLPRMGISWSARTEAPAGKTSPEELLAAAEASCFAMALSGTLSKLQKPPTRIHVTATATFDKVGDAFSVTLMDLDVVGKVPGMDAAQFQEAAKSTSQSCPISRAIKGNVELRLTARLE
ncbi:MAG TPA: OsmC family peroxiredoxin [Thermoplasmata archaeon]